MNPRNHAQEELATCALRCLQRGTGLLAARMAGMPISAGDLEDHRTEVIGELLDALNRAQPGLGDTFQAAMYPFCREVGDALPAVKTAGAGRFPTQEPLL